MPLENCDRCEKVFVSLANRRTCPECLAAEEELLRKIQRHIKENPVQNMESIAGEFGVDVDQLFEWVDERRLVISESALSRTCENCGVAIARGRLCGQCCRDLSDPSSGSNVNRTAKQTVAGMVNTRLVRDKE